MGNDRYFVFCDNRIWNSGYTDGFSTEAGGLSVVATTGFYASVALDSTKDDMEWDAVSIDATLPPECYLGFRAYASNSKHIEHNHETYELDELITGDLLSPEEKKVFLSQRMQASFDNPKEAPLFELKGRYLWFLLEAVPSKEKALRIERLRISYQPDSFMKLLPNVYSAYDKDGFMKRFVAVFQKLFEDFDEKIVDYHKQLNLDYLDMDGLRRMANLRSFVVSDVWEEEPLRALLRELNELYCMKGTKWALSRVIELFIGHKPMIQENESATGKNRHEEPYSFRITLPYACIGSKKRYEELLYLIEKFKPAFTKPILVLQRSQDDKDGQNGIVVSEEGIELTDDMFQSKLML